MALSLGLFTGALGCAPAMSEKDTKPLRDVLRTQMTQDGALPWSEVRQLAWTDFKDTPQTGGPEGAKTAYSLYYAVRCSRGEFESRVVAGFLPKGSWVKQAVLADPALSRRTLRHEQTHFDLTEVYARKLRKSYGELTKPCTRSDHDLEEIAQGIVREEQAVQRRYDAETRNGLAATEQGRWDKEAATQLASLRKYIQ